MMFHLRQALVTGGLAVGMLPWALGSSAAAAESSATSTIASSTLAPGTYDFQTSFTPVYFGAGSYVGVLKITVGNDGTITGNFRQMDVGSVSVVTGGVVGSRLWLDLGDGSSRILNARNDDGSIVAGVYFDGQPYRFAATLTPKPPAAI